MTLGALTVIDKSASQGPVFYDRITLVGDNSYPTNGSVGLQALFQAAILSHRTIIAVVPAFCGDAVPSYDPVTDKLKVQVMSTAAEVGNGVDESGLTYKLLVISK